jgi:hypothetical protein
VHRKTELLAALAAGQRLTVAFVSPSSPYASYVGKAVEYLPRVDEANGHPDAYPWHVVGLSDHDRVRHSMVAIA